MRGHIGLAGILGGGVIALIASQPVYAADTQVTGVRVNQTQGGVEIVLDTRDGERRPQVFTVNRGNSVVADLSNARLRLSGGNGFLQNAPAPGIQSVMVSQLDNNSVRVIITGEANAPASRVVQAANRITFNVAATGTAANRSPEAPGNPAIAQAEPAPGLAQSPSAPVMVPNPSINIDGVNVQQPTRATTNGVPPLLPRAVAPPVGDIAIATTDASAPNINLATNEVVPRLVLRDAPVRDVLSLLGRAAGLNVAYVSDTTGQQPGAEAGATPGAAAQPAGGARISLDIENEPVQNVFNYVLRISNLEANLVGRTIFVGPRLPNSARQVVVRTIRLNQVGVGAALNFLVGLGAETAVSRTRQVATVVALPVANAGGQASDINQVQTTQEERIETQRVDFQDSTPILRGLQVIGDERTNSLTLVGTPRAIQIALAQLTQLDVRRRQVAVNVRVIDVNLLGTNNASTSFSFGFGNFGIVNAGGIGLINFGGGQAPPALGVTPDTIGNPIGNNPANQVFNLANSFLAQLQAAVTQGNAKILTDPTLLVQEGQTAEVRLTEEVPTNITQEVTTAQGSNQATTTLEVETQPAGLILQIRVDRVDDNGFIALSVAPSISAPARQIQVPIGSGFPVTLLSERRLTSGQIRVRDGQTLILSGIIRDSDRTTVTKIPILGDIPILGALFRRTNRENIRQEVIVVLTPQILNDSDTSTFGYQYTPGREAQQLMQRQNRQQ